MPKSIQFLNASSRLPKAWRLLAITYNVAGKLPNKLTISHVLEKTMHSNDADVSFVIVSLQETRTGERFGVKAADNWRELFTASMWELGFVTIGANYMMSNLLMIFSTFKMCPAVRNCKFYYSKDFYNGAKGTMAAVVTLVNDVSLMILGSHFVHAPERCHIRVHQAGLVQALIQKARKQQKIDAVIWLGDLNFRNVGVEADALAEELRECKSAADLSTIINKYDQLTNVGFPDDALRDFKEARINFKPTYRITMGTANFDLLRVPSWTDRILTQNLTSEVYAAVDSAVYSDHQPVYSRLRFEGAHEVDAKWTVKFEDTNIWFIGLPLRVNFDGRAFWKHGGGSIWDWLGVYRVPDVNPHSVLTFTNIMLCVDYGTHYMAEFMSLPKGEYVVAYHSYHSNCIKGMSKVFTVQELSDAC